MKCDYILIKIMKVKQIYKCKVENFHVENKSYQIESVEGIHKSNMRNEDVQILIIENQICHYLPLNIGQHFPNVTHLDVKNSSLREVEQSMMKSMPKLKIIYLKNNLISEIPKDLFTFNTHLEFINFDDNRISKIDGNFIDNLPQIISVSLERNICINNFAMDEIGMNNLSNEIKSKCI